MSNERANIGESYPTSAKAFHLKIGRSQSVFKLQRNNIADNQSLVKSSTEFY